MYKITYKCNETLSPSSVRIGQVKKGRDRDSCSANYSPAFISVGN